MRVYNCVGARLLDGQRNNKACRKSRTAVELQLMSEQWANNKRVFHTQSNSTITDLRGLTFFFCYWKTIDIADIWNKRKPLEKIRKLRNHVTSWSGIAGCDRSSARLSRALSSFSEPKSRRWSAEIFKYTLFDLLDKTSDCTVGWSCLWKRKTLSGQHAFFMSARPVCANYMYC